MQWSIPKITPNLRIYHARADKLIARAEYREQARIGGAKGLGDDECQTQEREPTS
jgi:hypothetical protein